MSSEEQGWKQLGKNSPSGNVAGVRYWLGMTCGLSKSVNFECKDYVKYLGVLIDCVLSWKFHIEHIVVKISRLVGIIAKLWHFVPRNTLLRIY